MRTCLIFLLSFLLSGCSGSVQPQPTPSNTPVTVLTLPLVDLEPYVPWESMEPDIVPRYTIGEILCDKTMPDGTQIICYWHPDRLTDPDCAFTKYWAVCRGDELLRFCQETSAYDSSEDYDVTPFSDVLGQSGFRIQALRGAAYLAYDYYTVDENGVPHFLAGCANTVLEDDFNHDGVTELLWLYHGGRDAFYLSLVDGSVCEADIALLFQDNGGLTLCGADTDGLEKFLPVFFLPEAYPDSMDDPVAHPLLEGQLHFTTEALELRFPKSQLSSLNAYTLKDGVPQVKVFGTPDWTPLGPAIPAPQSWAGQDLAGRNEVKTWAGIKPAWTALQMVSARDGWLVLSIGRGIAGMDTYVYRTRDGGSTWDEASPLPGDAWLPAQAAFLDGSHAVITTSVFDGAPVYTTADGGQTWAEADLPLSEGDSVYSPEGLSLVGETIWLHMRAAGPNGSSHSETFFSTDGGKTWTLGI